MPQIHRRRTRSGQLVQPRSRPDPRANVFDDDDMAVYEDDEDFVGPTRVNGSGENGRTGSGRWTGPARPDLGTHGSAGSDRTGHGIGKVEKWDEWYDALHGSTKMSDLPSNISPGEFCLPCRWCYKRQLTVRYLFCTTGHPQGVRQSVYDPQSRHLQGHDISPRRMES